MAVTTNYIDNNCHLASIANSESAQCKQPYKCELC